MSKTKTPPPKPQGPVEKAFIVRKLSLAEWQVVDVLIQDGRVIKRTEREPNMSAIVARNLMFEIANNNDRD